MGVSVSRGEVCLEAAGESPGDPPQSDGGPISLQRWGGDPNRSRPAAHAAAAIGYNLGDS